MLQHVQRKSASLYILEEIQLLGYNAHPFSAERQESLRRKRRAKDLRRIAIAGLSSGQVMMLAVALYAGAAFGMENSTAALLRYFSLVLTLPVVFYAAWPFYQSAWNSLLGKRLNMDVPVSIAVIGAFIGSAWTTLQGHGVVYYDAITMFSLFLLSSRFLEHGAQEKSVEAAENLLKLAPAMATKVMDDGQHQPVPVLELNEGDTILAKPGETIAADAEVIEGESTVDEALLTGESRPVLKRVGAQVIAGSINQDGPLLLRVTGVGENTVLAGIVRLLDRAVAEKPRLAQLADQVAGHFTVGLLILTAIVGVVWWWLEPGQAFGIMLAVLVVTCPCALSLAAPTAFAAAGSHLLRHGILLTRGHALETLAKVNHVVFDKTGTLTYGKPLLQRIVTFSDLNEEHCLLLAASLEQASEHPLAQSFLSRVAGTDLMKVQEAQNLPGNGVSGWIAGVRYSLGNAALAGFEPVALPVDLAAGATLVWLCDEQCALAVFVLFDSLRPQASELVSQLKATGVQVTILSGDAADAVAHIAAEAGIESWQAALRPEDKLKALRELQQRGDVVAMVGDGVNDAPVLAGADVSIAMGGGTQVARASSDIVLLTENLLDIQRALKTGHASIAVMRQNFAWAVVYNLLALPFAAVGMIPPWLASIGMSTSSLVVVLNALRLR